LIFPEIFPTAAPIFSPVPAQIPAPVPATVASPVPASAPSQRPGLFPLFVSPVRSPLTVFDPVPVASQPGAVPGSQLGFFEATDVNANLNLALAQQAQTQCKPRKCRDDENDPRLECFKGLYKEGRIDTDFTSWVEIDCETGKEK
jgi:hypothetical protein